MNKFKNSRMKSFTWKHMVIFHKAEQFFSLQRRYTWRRNSIRQVLRYLRLNFKEGLGCTLLKINRDGKTLHLLLISVKLGYINVIKGWFGSSSVSQSCPTICNPMHFNMPGLPVHHQLLEFTHTHVHQVGDAIQPPHPLSSLSLPAFTFSQHQGIFKWVSSLH